MSDINFVEVDAKKINKAMVNNFEMALKDTLYPGDERRIFLDQETQIVVNLKNEINETGKQNLLKYASGVVLDAIGERTDTVRLQAEKAVTTLNFTLSGARSENTIIPKGKRVTPDGGLYFTVTKELIIPQGEIYGQVQAEAIEGGEKYNNFAPGQIKTLVDPIPYVASIENIDISSGGSDIETDDDYRERIRQAPSKYSTAGPEDAYIYWAKTADMDIGDVAISSASPGEVKITVLMKNGELPTQQVLDSVFAACNHKKRRPLTDKVTTSMPIVKTYDINLIYYIYKEKATEEMNIRAAIEGQQGSIYEYIRWQCSKLGKVINPDYLRQLMLVAGAFRINMSSPVYTELEENEVAKVGTITINYGGLI
jgi:phage-related baseplate assembly protein